MVRRFAMLALSLSMLLGLTGAHVLFAQDDKKKDEAKADAPKADAKANAPKKDEVKEASEAKKSSPKPIPPEVEEKLKAARRAVAEAIVAAQDAGLVKTSIDPPPILDILITGRAEDEDTLKARTGVSPEVFGAWFTGYGKTSGIVPQNDVRITQPSQGLKSWYDQRANMLNTEIEAVRKLKGTSAPKDTEEKKDEPKKDEPKKDESKKDEPKKDESKSADETKKDEAKPASADEPKKDEPKKDEPKSSDETKKDETKGEEKK